MALAWILPSATELGFSLDATFIQYVIVLRKYQWIKCSRKRNENCIKRKKINEEIKFLKKIHLIKLFLARKFKCFQAHSDMKRFGGVGFGFLNSRLAYFQAGASSISCDTNDIASTLKSSGKAAPWISSYPTVDAGQCSSCFTIEHIHHRVRNHINTCPFLHLGRAE